MSLEIEEPFNADFYKHLISSLTLNSRTLITELTTIAERNNDHAQEIASIIEERLKKCLPKHKLFALYLIDSICKNIGNPYNLIFNSDLYKLFTDTYLVVTDTNTRQEFINLFKTWINGKTNSGLQLFSTEVLQKIEEFIIKATTISQNYKPNIPLKLVPDMLLREANCLLQYIIMLDDDLNRYPEKEPILQNFIKVNYPIRNTIIASVNSVSDNVLGSSKQEFENNVNKYHIELQNARRAIDEQSFKQSELINSKEFKRMMRKIEFKIKLETKPDQKFFDVDSFFGNDTSIITLVTSFGVSQSKKEVASSVTTQKEIPSILEIKKSEETLGSTTGIVSGLGMGLDSVNFMESFLGSPKKDPQNSSEIGSDTYNPDSTNESAVVTKRKNSLDSQIRKKVRFDI